MNFTDDDITFSEFNDKLVFEDGYKKSHKQKGGKYDSMFSEFDEELVFEDDGYSKKRHGRKQKGGNNDVVFSEFDMGMFKNELRGGEPYTVESRATAPFQSNSLAIKLHAGRVVHYFTYKFLFFCKQNNYEMQ